MKKKIQSAPREEIEEIRQLSNKIRWIHDELELVKKDRVIDEQKEEEKDADFGIDDRMKRRLSRQMAKTDKFTEKEAKLRNEETQLLNQVALVVGYHEQLLE